MLLLRASISANSSYTLKSGAKELKPFVAAGDMIPGRGESNLGEGNSSVAGRRGGSMAAAVCWSVGTAAPVDRLARLLALVPEARLNMFETLAKNMAKFAFEPTNAHEEKSFLIFVKNVQIQ